jgi:hypothetical protein
VFIEGRCGRSNIGKSASPAPPIRDSGSQGRQDREHQPSSAVKGSQRPALPFSVGRLNRSDACQCVHHGYADAVIASRRALNARANASGSMSARRATTRVDRLPASVATQPSGTVHRARSCCSRRTTTAHAVAAAALTRSTTSSRTRVIGSSSGTAAIGRRWRSSVTARGSSVKRGERTHERGAVQNFAKQAGTGGGSVARDFFEFGPRKWRAR